MPQSTVLSHKGELSTGTYGGKRMLVWGGIEKERIICK